jgi:hydroxymethylglutaryl-CoA reductase (NADPH)
MPLILLKALRGSYTLKIQQDALYFSVTLPNIIVGTVGAGKHLPFAQSNLTNMGCMNEARPVGDNARRLAAITAAAVLCGELSLMAAQTNPSETDQKSLTTRKTYVHTTKRKKHDGKCRY